MIPLIIKSALSLAKKELLGFQAKALQAQEDGKPIERMGWQPSSVVALLACEQDLKEESTPTIQDALLKVQATLQRFKSCSYMGHWTPEEFWEPKDDEALSAIEAAQNEIAGAVPLFEGIA